MQKNKKIVIRYSEAFKHQIVKEIEEGGLALEEVRVKYGIKGYSTIQGWIKRIGKLGALPKIVRVETPDEKSQIKELERQVQELKNSLAETQVRFLISCPKERHIHPISRRVGPPGMMVMLHCLVVD